MNKAFKRGAVLLTIITAFIGGWEGKSNVAYRDIAGVATACFGETRGIKMGMRFTDDQCEEMLGAGIADFAAGVDRCLTNPRVPDLTYGAFVSLSYNIGVGAFCNSTLLRRANENKLRAACDQILVWDKARINGVLQPVRGLTNRRKAEHAMCLEGLAA